MALSVHLIVAARPNFMKAAPLYRELKKHAWCRPVLVHTGQHYDFDMSDVFFRDLGMPKPDHHLEIGSGSHAEQTAGVMVAYEKLCLKDRPDWTVVAGDVNSTLAATLAAKKLLIPVAHLEAGLRSNDRAMPEEINRIVTDSIADLLWTPSPDGDENLKREGVPPEKIERVGNIMIDAFEMQRPRIEAAGMADKMNLKPGGYAVATIHRPANVDTREALSAVVEALAAVANRLPVVFPVHPRTRKQLEAFGLFDRLKSAKDMVLASPLGYVEFMSLVKSSAAAITDSGGVQEETSYLGIPCLTLRTTTERPITVTQGTNRLAAVADLAASVDRILAGQWPKGRPIELWDGKTASRAAASLARVAGITLR
ncbi:MAG: UDP-N-acetylglucosamine 2-epimerase (non-hydrolyzing) [Alphaproteobacteria bacterium]|nr:UDP-N-acetylglucosamine 2-epimerase (non-hydrolyzing) [Alphaproteobacteria bacterium]